MNNGDNDLGWINKNIPEDVRLYVFLIFKVALLIFHHNQVDLMDYSIDLNNLHSTQKWLYGIEMGIHLVVLLAVYICLIFAIAFSIKRLNKINKT